MATTEHYENVIVCYQVCKSTVQRAETDGRVGKQVHNTVNEQRPEVQYWATDH
jgi:hypothetical protein